MGTNANKRCGDELSPSTTSFSGKHPDFANDVPDSFRNAPAHRREFDYARDPFIAKQLEAMKLTEAQRRGDSERGGGSEMVKRDKPHPELRPEHEQAPIRETFNRAWLREQREARLNELEWQRAERRKCPEHSMQMEWGKKNSNSAGRSARRFRKLNHTGAFFIASFTGICSLFVRVLYGREGHEIMDKYPSRHRLE